jgi:hypothetical protein
MRYRSRCTRSGRTGAAETFLHLRRRRGALQDPAEARKPPTDDELRVIDSAKTLVGKPPNARVVVNGKQFVLDCIGTVSAISYRMSIDVTKEFTRYTGNGVNRLYMTLKDRKVLHGDAYPRTGDVVIWDNTWDASGDSDRTNDQRTHAGVGLAVDEDGTIHYVHENMYKGVVIELMNLLKPSVPRDENGKTLNSGLAIATVPGGPRPQHSLSGEVFNTFGDVLAVKSSLAAEGEVPADAPPEGLALSDDPRPLNGPTCRSRYQKTPSGEGVRAEVGGTRVELVTPSVSSWCSNQTELAARRTTQ